MSADQQVGYVFGAGIRAALWTGSASSWIDLHPPGASESFAYGVGDGQQVGGVNILGVGHAALWTGSASSFVNLHPQGARESQARAAAAGFQVGWVDWGEGPLAAWWAGSASSLVLLHDFVPPHFHTSVAEAVWTYQGRTYVGGYGRNGLTARDEALLWVIPAPPSGLVLPALLTRRPRRR
jgi:hypothetical protein